jgi:hypothetical protein
VEKALHQIEQAIKKSKIEPADSGNVTRVISNLQTLLTTAQQQLIRSESDEPSEGRDPSSDLIDSHQITADDSLALDDAENPLQLLARASDLQLSPQGIQYVVNPSLPISSPVTTTHSKYAPSRAGTESFFVPLRASLDVGPELDPVELGLVSLEESTILMD